MVRKTEEKKEEQNLQTERISTIRCEDCSRVRKKKEKKEEQSIQTADSESVRFNARIVAGKNRACVLMCTK